MTLEDYILKHTEPQGALLEELERRAHVELMRPRMMSGHLQGRLLKMLVALIKPQRILEIGTYTGYSALSMAEALLEDARLITIEVDDEIEDFIRRFIERSPQRDQIDLRMGNALGLLPEILLQESFDFVYMDANKREYIAYYNLLIEHLPSGALILADNTLWDGKVVAEPQPHDPQTMAILSFNEHVAKDSRVDVLILPLRDGLSMIRKK